jgi:hypothetical protein
MAEPGGPVPGVLIDLEIADSLVGLRDGRLHLQGAGSASIVRAWHVRRGPCRTSAAVRDP